MVLEEQQQLWVFLQIRCGLKHRSTSCLFSSWYQWPAGGAAFNVFGVVVWVQTPPHQPRRKQTGGFIQPGAAPRLTSLFVCQHLLLIPGSAPSPRISIFSKRLGRPSGGRPGAGRQWRKKRRRAEQAEMQPLRYLTLGPCCVFLSAGGYDCTTGSPITLEFPLCH